MDRRDAEIEPKSEGIYEEENTYNENDDFDHEAVETMEEDEDQEHFTSELDGHVEYKEEKLMEHVYGHLIGNNMSHTELYYCTFKMSYVIL